MTAATLNVQLFRPISIDIDGKKRINLRWFVVRAPSLALALMSSYGVGGFINQSGKTPVIDILGLFNFDPVANIGAFAFDLVFLGVIGLSDQQLTDEDDTHKWYFGLNFGAAIVAGLFNVLYYAGGTYGGITPEAITHGALFAIFGLLYAMFYHRQLAPLAALQAKRDTDAYEAAEAEAARQRQYIADNPYKCDYCDIRKPTSRARNGHMAQCRNKPAKQ